MERVKYPRTLHLPWSPGATNDDKIDEDCNVFEGLEIVVTEKMDGENTTMYPDGYVHARSIDSKYHSSRTYVKALASSLIECNYRLCGENMFARHSVSYDNLSDYFLLFSAWDGNVCLSWSDTESIATEFGLSLVPVIYKGAWDEDLIRNIVVDTDTSEGYVVRPADTFSIDEFPIRKYVRDGHVQTDDHWMYKDIVKNSLNRK